MQQKLIKQYEFQLSKSVGFMVFGIFSLMSIYGIKTAMHNDKGLIIQRTFELSTQMATYFWWISSFMFLALASLGLFMIIKSFQEPRLITLDDYQITAPKSPISNKMLTVEYHQITKIDMNKIGKTRQLRMNTPNGKMVIPDVNFVHKSEFDEMVQILVQKIGAV